MHLFAEPPFRTNAAAITDDQHPDHQFRIDRRTTDGAVVGCKMASQARQLNEAIDRAQKVIGRHVILQAEPDEQRFLPNGAFTHHAYALVTTRTESTCRRDS